jgi:putative membrane protein
MIPRFSDLAANERTFLAWIRTSLALMAFGFVLQKLELLHEGLAASSASTSHLQPRPEGKLIGLVLIVIGVLILPAATLQYRRRIRQIQSDQTSAIDPRIDVALGIALVVLAATMLLYVVRNLAV